MTTPDISVVMITQPSRVHFRKLALRCLANQHGAPNAEVVIALDDGAHLTVAEAKELTERFGVDNVKVVYGTWKTVPDKHNAAIAATRAPWVALWDDDDWCAPDRLQVSYVATNDSDIVGPSTIHYHELIGDARRTLEFTTKAYVVDGASMFRRALWERTPFVPFRGPHPNAARWGTVGDWIVARAAQNHARVAPVTFSYVAMVHAGNASTPARPFRVAADGTVLDGPHDYRLVGGRDVAAGMTGEIMLRAYEHAFAAS